MGPEKKHEGWFDLDGRFPVNPSGSALCTNPIAVTALIRVIEAAVQVRGTALSNQLNDVETALTIGVGGISQFYTAIFSRTLLELGSLCFDGRSFFLTAFVVRTEF
jgi:acetyl-CoA acetyltransferase